MTKNNFFEFINGKRITFIGIGRSNLPLIEMFSKKGAIVSARDKDVNLGYPAEVLKNIGIQTMLGENYLDNLNEDIIFRAPGVNFYLPELQLAKRNGSIVTSEMEVFFELCPCKIYAVTGSDGKTTTTSIIAKMLQAEGARVHLGGNIGRPLLPIIDDVTMFDYAVVELSSFQLISMRKSPNVAVITNLSPNHLDVHKNMDEYVTAKKNIFMHQSAFEKTVLNLDNPITNSFVSEVGGKICGFSRTKSHFNGAYVVNDTIYYNGTEIMKVGDITIPGAHNVENYLAAIAAVYGDVSIDNMVATAKTFTGVAHRAEFVRELEGVKYYNDSIASSPSRAISGTLSLHKNKIIMIAGGADKNIEFTELGDEICEKVKVLILIKPEVQLEGYKPSAADKISESVMKSPKYFNNNPVIIRVKTMEEAVNAAREVAVSGDVVSLCPACTSFDMYQNFEVRGNHFKEIVIKLNAYSI